MKNEVKITISGKSGSGKSLLATVIKNALEDAKIPNVNVKLPELTEEEIKDVVNGNFKNPNLKIGLNEKTIINIVVEQESWK